MKKILFAIALAFTAVTAAYADPVVNGGSGTTNAVGAQQGQTTDVTSTSAASNAGQQNQQGVTLNIEAAQPRAIDRVISDQTTRSTSDSTQHIVYDNAQVIKNTPSVSGPQLTTSNDTCMGSTSGSVNVPGIGVSLGTTWVDDNCKRLKNGREMWNMGMKGAALALMCGDKENKEALEMTGYICPQSMTREERQARYAPAAK